MEFLEKRENVVKAAHPVKEVVTAEKFGSSLPGLIRAVPPICKEDVLRYAVPIEKRKQIKYSPPYHPSGIYFLIKSDEIIYIGRSTCVRWRLTCHEGRIREGRGYGAHDFDKFAWIDVPALQT